MSDANRLQPEWRLWLVWMILLSGVAFVSRPALPIDETRYLAVAWEMWQRGDFLVPFKNGEAYSHKPPLLFWLIHAGWFVTGVNGWWPRFIIPLLALASAWMTWRLARRLWPEAPETARSAPHVLFASLLWLVYSQALMFDVLITTCALIGLNALVEAAVTGQRRWWALYGLGVGLGILAKGPAILVHLLPVALFGPLWASRLGSDIRWSRWYAGVGIGLLFGAALALIWAIPAGAHGGEEYRNAIFWGQTANRMVESFAHRRPAWWYLPTLPLVLFPWLVWPRLIGSLAKTLRTDIGDAGVRFCLIWFVAALLIFSMISGKQPHYVLPEFPAAALLIAHALMRSPPAGRPWLPAAVLVLLGVGLAAFGFSGALQSRFNWPPVIPAWSGLPFVIAGLMLLGSANASGPTPQRMVWAMLLGMLGFFVGILQPLGHRYDTHVIGQSLARYQALGRPIAHQGKYHAQYHFGGRLVQPLSEMVAQEIPNWLEQHPDGIAVIYIEGPRDITAYRPLEVQAFRSRRVALVDRQAVAALRAASRNAPAASAED